MQDMTLSKALSIFELKSNYTEDELKKRYRELAKLYHPDHHTDETLEKQEEYNRKTQDLNEAYELLKKQLNPQQQYTYESASTYWSNHSYQGYGYYRPQKDNYSINQKQDIKEKIRKCIKNCPSEKLMDDVSDLVIEYIMETEKSEIPNLVFNNFKIKLKKIYMNYIESYAKEHNIPLFKIKQENFNYDCDCAKLFNQLTNCETTIEYDLSETIRKNQYHKHFKILEKKILDEKKRIREKMTYDTTLNEYLNILNEYEISVEKIIDEYNEKYNRFKLILDKFSHQFTNEIKEEFYEKIKIITLNATDEEFNDLIEEAIKESLQENECNKDEKKINAREIIYKELKKKYLVADRGIEVVNQLFVKAIELLYIENCTMKIAQEINNITFENPQEEYDTLIKLSEQTSEIKDDNSHKRK